ncbi:hypothetical protein ACR79N_26255 [Sphingobacterium siyangense]|uniref:hypothetical protein n=1 Tax=Sphingobacterium siyangense TaxID=459529 RepID=UPI003DA6B1D0
MNHATAHHKGNRSRSHRPQTETASPTAIEIRRLDAKDKRCGRTAKGQAQVGSQRNASADSVGHSPNIGSTSGTARIRDR